MTKTYLLKEHLNYMFYKLARFKSVLWINGIRDDQETEFLPIEILKYVNRLDADIIDCFTRLAEIEQEIFDGNEPIKIDQ